MYNKSSKPLKRKSKEAQIEELVSKRLNKDEKKETVADEKTNELEIKKRTLRSLRMKKTLHCGDISMAATGSQSYSISLDTMFTSINTSLCNIIHTVCHS